MDPKDGRDASAKAAGISRLRRASLTVEASFVVPIAFMTVVTVLIMLFYVHNRVWYRCAACEAAVTANMQGTDDQDAVREMAEKTAGQRISEQVMPGPVPEAEASAGKRKTQVRFSGKTYRFMNIELTPFQVDVSVERIRPELELRLMWLGKEVIN